MRPSNRMSGSYTSARSPRLVRHVHLMLLAILAIFALIACGAPEPPAPAPTISEFTASPETITAGDDSTLSWIVTNATSITIVDEDDNEIHDTTDLTGSITVNPTSTTTYTLTASDDTDSVDANVTITVTTPGTATLDELAATVVPGSQVALSWTSTNADTFDVFAVHASEPDVLLEGDVIGTATSLTVPIPSSERQLLRIVARSPVGDAQAEVSLTNVVVSAADYDPYVGPDFTGDTPVPGTLRFLVDTASPGDVIGFASDIDEIELYGVDKIFNGEGQVDAHLIINEDITLSGPASGVTIRGIAGVEAAPGVDPFTWRSRVLYVTLGSEVVVENLTLTGGTFIYVGAGIRNDGILTIRNSVITENRSWINGGGVYNNESGVLTIENSLIANNTSAVEDDEVNTTFNIRDLYPTFVSNGGYGGGVFNAGGSVSIVDSVISDNLVKVSGGGVYNELGGAVSAVNSQIDDNRADFSLYADEDPDFTPFSYGGGLLNIGMLTISATSVSGNDARYNGGGLYLTAVGTADLSSVDFNFNSADFGGAIFHRYFDDDSSNLTLSNVPDTGTNTARTASPFIHTQSVPAPDITAFMQVEEAVPGLFYLPPGVDRTFGR